MKLSLIFKKRWCIVGMVVAGFLLLASLPSLFWAPHIKDEDFPHSGEVVSIAADSFVLGGPRQGRELVIELTASTTIKGGLVVGEFVQVFGNIKEPGVIVAKRVLVVDGPRKKPHD